jgi:hypothetical protein
MKKLKVNVSYVMDIKHVYMKNDVAHALYAHQIVVVSIVNRLESSVLIGNPIVSVVTVF